MPARRARLAAPPAVRAELRHRVDEALTGVEEPWRAGRQKREADETEERGEHQPGARGPVPGGAAAEEPDEDGRSDEIVQRGVREVGGDAEGGGLGEEAVQGVLGVQVECLLGPEYRHAVVDGGRHIAAGEQPAGRVRHVDHGDQRQFGPPAGPMAEARCTASERSPSCVQATLGQRSTVRCMRKRSVSGSRTATALRPRPVEGRSERPAGCPGSGAR